MSRNKELISLREQVRGLKKRNATLVKASVANHNGMMYWKNKYAILQEVSYDAVQSIQDRLLYD